jgi:hypothetical protein
MSKYPTNLLLYSCLGGMMVKRKLSSYLVPGIVDWLRVK